MQRNRWVPTRADDVRLVSRTVGAVLSVPLYAVVALAASTASLLTIVVVSLSTYWLVTAIEYGGDEACPIDLG